MPLELFARGRGALATLFAAGAFMDFGSTVGNIHLQAYL